MFFRIIYNPDLFVSLKGLVGVILTDPLFIDNLLNLPLIKKIKISLFSYLTGYILSLLFNEIVA